jgi:hypothetical protein
MPRPALWLFLLLAVTPFVFAEENPPPEKPTTETPNFLNLATPAKHPLATEEDEAAKEPAEPKSFGDRTIQIGLRPEKPQAPCATCKSTGHVKTLPFKPFVLFEGDTPPEPEVSLGWKPCPDCTRGKKAGERFDREKERLAQREKAYTTHEKALGMEFLDLETRHVTGHFQTQKSEAKEIAFVLEQVAQRMEEMGISELLPASPGAAHIVVCENEARYSAYLDFATTDLKRDNQWLNLARKTASFGQGHIGVLRRDKLVFPQGSALGNMTLFSYAWIMLRISSGDKAPDWFSQGFSSLIETLAYDPPRCYSINYEENKLHFDKPWNRSVADGVRANKTRSWESAFSMKLIGMKLLEYQQCWSMVKFLTHKNGAAFCKLPGLYKQGLSDKDALEKAYETTLQKLEQEWKGWVTTAK